MKHATSSDVHHRWYSGEPAHSNAVIILLIGRYWLLFRTHNTLISCWYRPTIATPTYLEFDTVERSAPGFRVDSRSFDWRTNKTVDLWLCFAGHCDFVDKGSSQRQLNENNYSLENLKQHLCESIWKKVRFKNHRRSASNFTRYRQI